MNEENNLAIEEITMNAFGIKAQDNCIFVDLKECTTEKINLFKAKVSNSPLITFEEWNGQIVAAADMVPGGHISLSSVGLGGSIGYRAKMGNVKGIVASGHVLSTANSNVYNNGKLVGVVKAVRTSGMVDAAFVALNAGFEGTNSIGSRSISTSIEVMGSGGQVSLRGNKNQSDGSVVATGVACNVKIESTGVKIRISNCVRCNYESAHGDSGGLIYSTNRLNTLGIHEGADDNNVYSYYVLANSINGALGLTRY